MTAWVRRTPAWVVALMGFAAAFVAVTWPLLPRFDRATFGGPGDGWALIWQTRFRLEHGLSYFSPTFGFDAGWPVGTELTSSMLLSNAAVELPHAGLLALGLSDIAAYNVIVFAAATTSSMAMYFVLRRFGCRPAVAFWGGLVYLLAPWHLEKLSIHPTLGAMAALPLLLLGIVEWVHRPGWRSGLLLVAAVTLATYTHSYYGVGVALTLTAALPIVLIAAHRRNTLKTILAPTALLAGALALVPVPLAAALSLQSSDVSLLLNRPLYLFDLVARPSLWLLPSVDNPVFGDLSRQYLEGRSPLNEGELALYVGLLTLALAAVGIYAAIRFGTHALGAALAAAMVLVGVAFSLPALVGLPFVDSRVRMPISYLTDYLTFISTPARFFALTLTGMVVLGALGLQYLSTKVSGSVALGLVAAACVVSAVELPFHRDRFVVEARPTPLVQAIERNVPDGLPVAEYPSTESFYLPMARQLYYQVHHHHPLLNGAPATSLEDSVRLAVEDPSDEATPRKLALLGFRYAAYDLQQAIERAAVVGRPMVEALGYQPPKGFEVLERTSDRGLVMRVTARPAAAFATIGSGFTRAGRWMTKERATLLTCATASGPHTMKFHISSFALSRLLRVANRGFLYVKGPEETVRIKVPLRRGWQLVGLRLVGSKPTRPSDVIPGNADLRPLVVSIGPISIDGPRGSSEVCARPTRLDNIPTVG